MYTVAWIASFCWVGFSINNETLYSNEQTPIPREVDMCIIRPTLGYATVCTYVCRLYRISSYVRQIMILEWQKRVFGNMERLSCRTSRMGSRKESNRSAS